MSSKKNIWLEAGYALFAEKGIAALNVDMLSKKVGVSRSSYYFLFKNNDGYFNELINYWVERGTFDKIKEALVLPDPETRFKSLINKVLKDPISMRFNQQINHLSLSRPNLREKVMPAYKIRNDFVIDIFLDLGIEENRVKENSDILLSLSHGWFNRNMLGLLGKDVGEEEVDKLWNTMVKILKK